MRPTTLLSILTLLAIAAPAGAQEAAVHYGGGLAPTSQNDGLTVALTRTGAEVAARAGFGVQCRRVNFPNVFARARGTVTGDAFTAAGTTRIARGLRVRMRVEGTFGAEHANGSVSRRIIRGRRGPRGCRVTERMAVSMRTAPAPVGAPAKPTAPVVWRGLSSQLSGGHRLPVMVAVSSDLAKVTGRWSAMAKCPRGSLPVENLSPAATIGEDGAFGRNERFTIRYGGGFSERYRVSFAGRFLADGVTGTLRARVTVYDGSRVVARCDSGEQTWSAAS